MGMSTPTSSIVVNLIKCLIAFYSIYYIISSICFGAFKLQRFDGTMPFDFKRWIDFRFCCVSYSSLEIANLVAMEATFFFSTWFFLLIVPQRFWDYVFTISLFHVALSSLVMLSLPYNWSWWICLALGILTMISLGEMVRYFYKLKHPGVDTKVQELHCPDTGLTFYPKDSDHSDTDDNRTNRP